MLLTIPIALWITARGNITSQSESIACSKIPRLSLKSHLIVNQGVAGTRFGSLEFQIGSLESVKNIIGSLK